MYLILRYYLINLLSKCFLEYKCCVAPYKVSGEYLFHCWKAGEDNPYGCVALKAGVAPSAYKQLCRPGYLWVQWKKKCQRKD